MNSIPLFIRHTNHYQLMRIDTLSQGDINLLNKAFVNLVGKSYDSQNPVHQQVYHVLTCALSGDNDSLNRILVEVSEGDPENQRALLSKAYELAFNKGNRSVYERLEAYQNTNAVFNELRAQNLVDKVLKKPQPWTINNPYGWV